jgi:uncharacterized membrane protein YphA (DoxX/SURF4 family)
MSYKHRTGMVAGIILGLIFVVAGFGKLLTDAEGFTMIFNPFPGFLASAFADAIFIWLPYLEVVIGLLLIIGVLPKLMAVIAAVLTAGFITDKVWLLSQGLGYEPCSCFGILDRIIGAELSTADSLYLDIIMLALVLIVLFWHKSSFFNIYPQFLDRGNHE